jgi:tetratricopeptide (TPR) repeat protein
MVNRLVWCFLLALALQAQTKYETTSVLGRKYYSLPDAKGTVAAAEKALASDPKNVDLLVKLAKAQAGVWESNEAVATYTRLLAIQPANADFYTERGHRHLPLRNYALALADLNKAAALHSKNPDTYYHLGLAHYFLGEFGAAADAFGQAVALAPDTDSRINSTNWQYASLRRAKKTAEAAQLLATITPEMKNKAPHTYHYLSLVRFFQGVMKESAALPAEPPAGNTDQETELAFDTVGYGIGNWYLYNNQPAKAKEYFQKVAKGHVWVTWGFVGSETELARMK